MKINPSLVIITGISLASITCLQAGSTKLNTNGTWTISDATTSGVSLLTVTGSSGTTGKISTNDLSTNFLNATQESNFNGVTIGRGNGNLSYNTAIGYAVLDGSSATGNGVTGIGSYALQINSSGSNNTAVGHAAMQYNTSGEYNTASGLYAMRNNNTGSYNTTMGCQSLINNKGNSNTALGVNGLYHKIFGDSNIAIGNEAATLQMNGAALTSTTGSIYIGVNSRGFSNADYKAIVIGTDAVGEGANTTVIGTSSTVSTRLYGKTTTDSLQVNGNTVLSGTVVLAQAQGDISMGAYQ